MRRSRRWWAVPIERSANGAPGPGTGRASMRPLVRGSRAFFPSVQRAQVTALACTLPRDSGRPLSRWSSTELVAAAQARGIAAAISASTIRRWLRAEKIKPWQYHSWQQPTDPRFLERAIPVLNLYERAQELAAKGHVVVCADEKTSIQARQSEGTPRPTCPGMPLRIGDRYHRRGALQLFAALLVSTGETLARCFERKRFVEFQTFLCTLFGSLWCQNSRRVHLILDNGSTHAPKQLPVWLRTLRLPFAVELHWLPVHASWLDQVELVFSTVQRKVLTPNNFRNRDELEAILLTHFDERNKHPAPIRWSYTSANLRKHVAARSRPRALIEA
jgi:DDE superfamily endonuclease